MLRLKLLQHLHLLLLIARGLSHLLLPLVIHHLLHHRAGLAIEITQLTILRLDLGGVDGWSIGDDMCPPLHLVGFVQVDCDLLACGRGLERPGGFIGVDGFGEVTL
jgi:hypothetical protein